MDPDTNLTSDIYVLLSEEKPIIFDSLVETLANRWILRNRQTICLILRNGKCLKPFSFKPNFSRGPPRKTKYPTLNMHVYQKQMMVNISEVIEVYDIRKEQVKKRKEDLIKLIANFMNVLASKVKGGVHFTPF